MRLLKSRNSAGWATLWCLAIGLGVFMAPPPAPAVTPEDADLAFQSLNDVYWDQSARFYRKEESGSQKADFWLSAQLWDTVMDQYVRTGSDAVKQQIHDLYDGFIEEYPDWTTNRFNDDIMWWAIACARAYSLTGDERYLTRAQDSFDFVYDNFHDDEMGGGIYWISERTSKNSCVNSPAVIAAVWLYDLLDEPAYLEKAKSLYAWQKETLTEDNGRVLDSIRYESDGQSTRFDRRAFTYNQGTYIGAGVLLYLQTDDETYLEDAVQAAQWTRENLSVTDDQILRGEGQGDGGAFKGILVRYMKMLIEDGGRDEFLPWMRTNARVAWSNRRPDDNIMGPDWSAPAGRRIQSQTATSAVAVVINFVDE